MYSNEQELVEDFIGFLKSPVNPWGIQAFTEEFDYSAGRTDVIAAAHTQVLAFEAKLRLWRAALAQAYRNRCFAHRSYVVLPHDAAYKALKFEPEFRRRKVGLCAVTSNGIVELLESAVNEPCLSWLSQKAMDVVHGVKEPRNGL